jgi:hypothetical protein
LCAKRNRSLRSKQGYSNDDDGDISDTPPDVRENVCRLLSFSEITMIVDNTSNTLTIVEKFQPFS